MSRRNDSILKPMTSEKGLNRDELNVSILPNNSFITFFKDINNINCNNEHDIDISTKISCTYIDIDSFHYKIILKARSVYST